MTRHKMKAQVNATMKVNLGLCLCIIYILHADPKPPKCIENEIVTIITPPACT